MKIERYAAIDIGSNAVRVLISNVISSKMKSPKFMKSSMVRVPIRLGEDSFTVGEISDKNKKRMVKAMKAFKHIMKISNVTSYMACATSALREANNAEEVVELVKRTTGIQILIIDGKREAEIISTTNIFESINKNKTFLFIDVGGGSTEFSVLVKGERIVSKSFKVGTVRMINNMVSDKIWVEIQRWIEQNTKGYTKLSLLGSGGNINKLFKIAGIKEGRPLSFIKLNTLYSELNQLTYEERIVQWELNPDRSDVIIPATQIYLKALQWSGASEIYVPKIGLADGMIKVLYAENKNL
ncbi:rod shape-determining protein [Flavobacteriaceae bacterium]|nr:rod shape-determining protein [Flavobacteriaceae bacterium]MDB2672707.1 rod shape-determining protein [Flavobacteriaceae bacterium]MDB9941547.1 rod shape-determining protein [Flavobacteriaceae bacterium]